MNFLIYFQQTWFPSEAHASGVDNNGWDYMQEKHINPIHESRFMRAEAQIPNGT